MTSETLTACRRLVFAVCRSASLTDPDAEEVLSRVLARVVEAMQLYDRRGRPRTRVLTERERDVVRFVRRVVPMVIADVQSESHTEAPIDEDGSTLETREMYGQTRRNGVWQGVPVAAPNATEADRRRAERVERVRLALVEGGSVPRAASILGVSPQAVRRAIASHSGLARFRGRSWGGSRRGAGRKTARLIKRNRIQR